MTLISSLNHLNFIRYKDLYPNDDFMFIFKEKVNASVVESRFEQKEALIERMNNFDLIHQDAGGVADNCIFELDNLTNSNNPILNLKELCPSGVTFLERNKKIIAEYL
jgi:hypothetical protein